MRRDAIRIPFLLALLLAGGGSGLADDIRVPVPEGWSETAVFDFIGGHFVAALESETGMAHSLIVHRLGDTEFIDLRGRVYGLQLSPDGGLLLANQVWTVDPDGGSCYGDGASLISTEGRVHWTKQEPFGFRFSTTGQSILAWQPGGECEAGSQVQVYGLRGGFRGLYDAGQPVASAVALGAGERVVLALANRVVCVDLSEEAEVRWTLDHEPPARSLRAGGADRILVEAGRGAFRLVDGRGEVLYDYDPERLAEGDPERSARDYMRYRAFPAPRGADLLLFDGTSKGFRVDPDSGRLVKVRFNADPPAGFARATYIRNSRFIFGGDGAFVVRPVTTKDE